MRGGGHNITFNSAFVFDCNGHKIVGDSTIDPGLANPGVYIVSGPHHVKNCNISSFKVGIRMPPAALVYNNIINSGGYQHVDGTVGIEVGSTSSSRMFERVTIRDNIIKNVNIGIDDDSLEPFGSDNKIILNIIDNTSYGIVLDQPSGVIVSNNTITNSQNAIDLLVPKINNSWNISKTLGTNIINGLYLGGNFWSNYNGVDTDGDGIGNTLIPYNGSGSIVGGDYLPLTNRTSIPNQKPKNQQPKTGKNIIEK